MTDINTGAALSGATVTLYNTDGSVWQTTTTSTSGFYGFDLGTRCNSFVVKVSKAGYWEEKQTVVMKRDPAGCWGYGNARMPADPCNKGAALGAMFATWNSAQLSVQHSWTFTTAAQASVTGFTVANGDTTPHTASNVRSQIPQRLVCTHGVFWKSSSPSVEQVLVVQQMSSYYTIPNYPDYMVPPGSPPAGHYVVMDLAPHSCTPYGWLSAGTFSLPLALGVEVAVNLDTGGTPFGYNTRLPDTLLEGGSGHSRNMNIIVNNNDAVSHRAMWFVEGTGTTYEVLHFWQIW